MRSGGDRLTQDVDIESRAVLDDGVTGIVTTLRTTAQLNALAQDIYNLALVRGQRESSGK